MLTPVGNTYGTFLHTLGTSLGSMQQTRGSDGDRAFANLDDLLGGIAKEGGKISLDLLAKNFNLSRADFLEAVLKGQEKGLWTLPEENGDQIVQLTGLGKAFVKAARLAESAGAAPDRVDRYSRVRDGRAHRSGRTDFAP